MCTLSIIPVGAHDLGQSGSGVRAVCNRDESRLRAIALPPQLRQCGRHEAMMPIDPVSDGTWIGVSDAGLILVLMNIYAGSPAAPQTIGPARTSPLVSRGRIIPRVLEAATLEEALRIIGEMNHHQFDPFRLVVVDRTRFAEFTWWAEAARATQPVRIERPLFFTSSGLGDQLVAMPRRKLFDEMFARDRDWQQGQDAFHRHQWPDNPGASVWMTRDNAMTVSRTEVELGPDRATMTYHARIGDSPGTSGAMSQTLGIIRV